MGGGSIGDVVLIWPGRGFDELKKDRKKNDFWLVKINKNIRRDKKAKKYLKK
jgi:G:T-mismatch repair DNA endonuclease (very short patch repair protein)